MKPELEEESEYDAMVREFFNKIAGDDLEIDWMELKQVLDYALMKGGSADRGWTRGTGRRNGTARGEAGREKREGERAPLEEKPLSRTGVSRPFQTARVAADSTLYLPVWTDTRSLS